MQHRLRQLTRKEEEGEFSASLLLFRVPSVVVVVVVVVVVLLVVVVLVTVSVESVLSATAESEVGFVVGTDWEEEEE